MSKTYGLPGIRIGWLVCKEKSVMEQLLAAKEQIFICNSVIDEEIALQVLQQKNTLLPNIIADVKTKLGIVTNWLKTQPLLDYVLPDGGVACFPRINLSINTKDFYKQLLMPNTEPT
jgi:aspartate/methionine/tyrosine aminotransferase